MRVLLVSLFLFVHQTFGFIPPIVSVLKDSFDNRKLSDGVEFSFSHQVANSNNESFNIEERILLDSRGLKFLWRVAGQGQWIPGRLEKRNYILGGTQKVNARSLLFVKYFTARNAIEFRDALVNERFLQWEQLKQFKEGFELQGDPQTWDIKGNYLQHDTISLFLLPTGPSIAVVGYQDNSTKRVVYFDKNSLSLKKLDWFSGGEALGWNFGSNMVEFKGALFSKTANLNRGNAELISSDLIGIKQLNKRQLQDWLQLWNKTSNYRNEIASGEENLRTFLTNR